MTALSSFLQDKGVTIEGEPSNPNTLNHWLRHNNGYVCVAGDCDNLNLPDVHALDERVTLVGFERSFTLSDVISWIKRGWAAILHVQNSSHFVLATGYFVDSSNEPNGTIIVRDSFFPRLTREFNEVSHVLLYSWTQ